MSDERARYMDFIKGLKRKIVEYEEMLTFVSNRTTYAIFNGVDFETCRRSKDTGATRKGCNPVVVIKGDQYIEISERDFAEANNGISVNHNIALEDHEEKKNINETPSPDMRGIKEGVAVTHKGFGQGIVTSVDDSRIIVNFGSEEKHFILPEAISRGFLSIS